MKDRNRHDPSRGGGGMPITRKKKKGKDDMPFPPAKGKGKPKGKDKPMKGETEKRERNMGGHDEEGRRRIRERNDAFPINRRPTALMSRGSKKSNGKSSSKANTGNPKPGTASTVVASPSKMANPGTEKPPTVAASPSAPKGMSANAYGGNAKPGRKR